MMVSYLLEALANQPELNVTHLNLSVSIQSDQIGRLSFKKILRLAFICLKLFKLLVFERPQLALLIPAPSKKAAIMRDLPLVTLLRLFQIPRIFHWHAYGLGVYCKHLKPGFWKHLMHWNYDQAQASWILSSRLEEDAKVFQPDSIKIIPNGIPDDFETIAQTLMAQRQMRLRTRISNPNANNPNINLLYLSALSEEKGLFTALETLRQLNDHTTARLVIAGTFADTATQQAFESFCQRYPDLQIELAGFVEGDAKKQLLEQSDLLLFTGTYPYECQPLTLIECLSAGLPFTALNWRGIPDLVPTGLSFLVDKPTPEAFAAQAKHILELDCFEQLRNHYLSRFTRAHFQQNVIASLERSPLR
jgi:glycosyltransferase involved in cell wall biosynthesis